MKPHGNPRILIAEYVAGRTCGERFLTVGHGKENPEPNPNPQHPKPSTLGLKLATHVSNVLLENHSRIAVAAAPGPVRNCFGPGTATFREHETCVSP